MRFNLTPTITISTRAELDAAVAELRAEGVDEDWLGILQERAEAHLIEELCPHGALTAACHDARCRPPTSGGTGGSLPKNGGASAPAKKSVKEPPHKNLSSQNNPDTEFGRRIRSMISGDLDLRMLSKEYIDRDVAERVKNQRDLDILRQKERWAPDSKRVNLGDQIEVNRIGFTEESGKTADRAKDILKGNAGRSLQQILRDGPTAGDEVEEAIHAVMVQRRDHDPYAAVIVKIGDGNVVVRIRGKYQSEMSGVTMSINPEQEAAVTRVGHAIRDEIAARKAARFNEDEMKADHDMQMEGVLNIVHRHGYRDIEMKDVEFFQYGGTEIGFRIFGSLGNVSVNEPAVKAMRDEVREYSRSVGITNSNWEHRKADLLYRQHREILHEVLSEVRSMGGTLVDLPRHRAPKRGYGRSSHEQVRDAQTMYPTDWIDASNKHKYHIKFKQTTGRAHYMHNNGGESELTLDGSHGTAVHELAHRMEATVPGVRALEREFFSRRAGSDTIEKMGKGYRADEETAPDDFFDRYVGKIYNDGYYEVMSMGWEHLQGHPGWGKVDPDHQAFVLGTLATAYRSEG